MNSWVGGIDSEGRNVGRAFNSGFTVTRRFDQMIDPPPAQKNVFIDEREDSINDGTFQIAMNGWPDQPDTYRMVDFPADWHNRGANLSFADNHVEYWRWEDPRSMPPHEPGQELPLNVEFPDNPDVRRLQEVSSRPIPKN
jgi:prepilin-type processing-associated H-X9-DG protein